MGRFPMSVRVALRFVGAFKAAKVGEGLVGRFARSESGNVAMLFGLTIMMILAAVGGAVDYGRWLNARQQTQHAIDAAVLAAGRVLQISGGNAAAALDTAQRYYDELKSRGTSRDTINFELTDSGSAVQATGDAAVATPFLNIIHIQELPVFTSAKAILAVGGNQQTNIEIGMMLDVTGSMAGSKIQDLRDAAKDLVNIVVWDNQGEYTSRVAIAPFAPRINVGSYISALTGLPETKRFNNSNRKPIQCVTERTGTHAFTDEAPANNRYLSAYKGNTGNTAVNDSANYSSSGSCSTPSSGQSILPLTSNKTTLNAKIDALGASGATAGQLGTAFAWYLISPKWANIWPADSKPAPYSDITTLGDEGQPKLQKIVILMTDGAYNTYGGTQYGDNSSQAVQIADNSKLLCENMKGEGVIVYSVGFALARNSLPLRTLQACATSDAHFYDTSTGDQLRQAFRDIALKISTLRIAS